MGYRSDVMAIIYPEAQVEGGESAAYDQLKLLMGTTFKDVSDEFSAYMTWHDVGFVLKFDLPDVKWYPSYKDVQMFENMLVTLVTLGELEIYCTEFVRVGEESDDTEERHTGNDKQYYLNVRRSIDCNI